jgi:hypothetical protein
MARQSNADKLSQYRARVEGAKQFVKQMNYDQLWQRMINLYRGRHYRGQAVGDRLLVNIAFSTINTLVPSVSIGRPKINVNPRTPEDGDKAIVTESIINYWWNHYDCQTEFQRAVKDYLVLGHGWIKTGYRFVEEAKLDEIEYSADEAAQERPADDSESQLVIREDRPYVERIDPFDMCVDPDATTMENARWIAQRIRRPLKAAKADKRYDYAARQQLTAVSYGKTGDGASYIGASPNPAGFVFGTSEDEAYCDIYEFYNIETGEMSVFGDGGDKFLIKPLKMPYVFGHPFIMLRNYEIPGFFFPMGELEAIEPLQYELNETRTQMMNHRKRYSRKWLAMESAFDDFGRTMLASDDDNVIVPVKGSENLNNVVVPMPAVINPPEFYNQSALIQNDIDRVSGVSEYQRGAIPETTRTAREASIIAEAGNARVAEKLVTIENNIAKCAQNLIMLAQQFMTGEQTVRIVGSEAAPVWLTFDKDYIAGQFDFTVEAGSTAPRNEAFRRDMALQMVAAMQPFAQAGLVNLGKLAEYVLSVGFGVKDPQSFLTPQALGQAGPMVGEPDQPMGMEGMPPELAGLMGQQMAGAAPQIPPGLIPNAPIQGPAPQVGAPPLGALESLPPEILQALLAQGR